jgi:hypothetical protein
MDDRNELDFLLGYFKATQEQKLPLRPAKVNVVGTGKHQTIILYFLAIQSCILELQSLEVVQWYLLPLCMMKRPVVSKLIEKDNE